MAGRPNPSPAVPPQGGSGGSSRSSGGVAVGREIAEFTIVVDTEPGDHPPVSSDRIRAAQISLLLDTAVTGTYASDLRSGHCQVSPGILRLLGHPAGRPPPENLELLNLIHPDDVGAFEQARRQCIVSGEVSELTYRIRRQDDAYVWVTGTTRPMADENNRPIMIVGILRDVSETREIEERMRLSELRYRSLFTNSPLPMLVLDPRAETITEVNQAALALYDYPKDLLDGKPLAILFDSGQARGFRRLVEDPDRSGMHGIKMRHRRRDGTVLDVECRLCPIQSNAKSAYVVLVNDQTESLAARAEIRRLVAIDPLTQLPNRLSLSYRLSQALERSKTGSTFGALLHINLDSFKSVNEALGYDGANQLLIEIAERLKRGGRPNDVVARVAGDEFVVLLERLPGNEERAAKAAESLANRLLDAIREPIHIDGAHYLVTASIGVALFDEHTQTVEYALRSADAAVERSRVLGRNQVRFCDPSMQQAVERRAALEMDLRRALRSDQFELYFQVQVDESMRPKGAEVLLRWNHPTRGMIPPLEFIGLAEQTGTIVPIGRWVLEQACTTLAQWAGDEPLARLRLSVNVSARQFRQPDFVAQVREALAVTGANPAMLSLELTESLLLDYAEEAIQKMNDIRAMGVGFSLDDFGTGYSSLAYLKRLPLDELKIDRAFTRDIMTDPSDAVIVRTIIGMARNLGLALIAEGVESANQHELLARWGCSGFQGFHYGRPKPCADFVESVVTVLTTTRGGAMTESKADEPAAGRAVRPVSVK